MANIYWIDPFLTQLSSKKDYVLMHKDSYWDFISIGANSDGLLDDSAFSFHFCSTKKAFWVALKGPCIEN